MSGSNFSVTPNVNVAFNCDDKNVTTAFYTNDEPVGMVAFTRPEAAALGKLIAETGVWKDSPISVSPSDLKLFGNRLRQYGENGV